MGWQIIEAALWGVAIAIGVFWWRSTPATTRFIDLASYFLGSLTLIVGLFAFYNSHGEKLQIVDRMLIKSNIVDIQFETTVGRGSSAFECSTRRIVLRSLSELNAISSTNMLMR